MRNRFLLIFLLSFVCTEALAVPAYLSQQGRLLQTDLEPLGGVADLTFRLYSSTDAQVAIWTETINVSFDNGFYSVILGTTTQLSTEIFDGSELYMTVAVSGEEEFDQRIRLTSVPYSIRANFADKGDWPEEDDDLATKSYVDENSIGPHDHNDIYYIRTDVEELISEKANLDHEHDSYHTRTEVEELLAGKADLDHEHEGYLVESDLSTVSLTGNFSDLLEIPEGLADGDDNTTYSVDLGLTMEDNVISVNPGSVQSRVAETCEVGSTIREISSDGTVVCEPGYTDSQAREALGEQLGEIDETIANLRDDIDSNTTAIDDIDTTHIGDLADLFRYLTVDTDSNTITISGADVHFAQKFYGNNLTFRNCGDTYSCTPRECLDLCADHGERMAFVDEVYAFASEKRHRCAHMWMLDRNNLDQPVSGYPMYANRTTSGCGRRNTGDIPRIEALSVDNWDSTREFDCACATIN